MEIKIFESQTHYQLMGKGPSLVLLHGWSHDWQTWNPVIGELSKDYTLIIPDLPGFGQSKCSEAWDSYQYADWLNEFTDKVIKNKKFSILGHSFGGKIASIFAAKHPQRVKKLIVVDASGIPVALPSDKKLKQSLIGIVPSFVKDLIPYQLKTKILSSQGLATDSLNASKQQKQILKKILQENITADLKNISVPTLIIWGANDQETPLEKGKIFHNSIKNSQLEVFENSGHFPYVDETDKFINVVKKFL